MQNKGTDYIRRILRDKARQKRWRQIMLCLSCIVVFCTIYVLILPAITLEKKTTCEEENRSQYRKNNPWYRKRTKASSKVMIQMKWNLYRASQLKRKPMTSKMSRLPKTRKRRWTSILPREKRMELQRQQTRQ